MLIPFTVRKIPLFRQLLHEGKPLLRGMIRSRKKDYPHNSIRLPERLLFRENKISRFSY